MRLFVALEPPAAVRAALARWAREAVGEDAALRLVDPVALHLTLAFLGERADADAGLLAPALARVLGRGFDPPRDACAAAPLWLAPRRPHVLTVAVADPSGRLAALRARVVEACAGALAWGPGAVAASRRVTRTIRAEVALVVVALGATGALAGSAPVGTTPAAAAPPAVAAAGPTAAVRRLGALRVRIDVAPGRVGDNDVAVDVLDAASGRPAHVEQVTLAAALPTAGVGPLEATAARRGPGRYGRTTPLPVAGTWSLRVTVRTSAFDEVDTTVPIAVR